MPDQETFPDVVVVVDCPICERPLDYDGNTFSCGTCLVSWPRSGYGHQATSHRKDDGWCEARCPDWVDVLEEGRFCNLDAGHDGDHELDGYQGRTLTWPQDADLPQDETRVDLGGGMVVPLSEVMDDD